MLKLVSYLAGAVIRFFLVMLGLEILDAAWRHWFPATHDSQAGQIAARIVINLAIIRFVFRVPLEKTGQLLLRYRAASASVAGILGLLLTGCYDPNAQRSRIVREVESAGSGSISTYSQPGLAEWFSHRPQLAQKIAYECAPIRQTAGANWATSAEGTVCLMAEREAPPPPILSDQRSW